MRVYGCEVGLCETEPKIGLWAVVLENSWGVPWTERSSSPWRVTGISEEVMLRLAPCWPQQRTAHWERPWSGGLRSRRRRQQVEWLDGMRIDRRESEWTQEVLMEGGLELWFIEFSKSQRLNWTGEIHLEGIKKSICYLDWLIWQETWYLSVWLLSIIRWWEEEVSSYKYDHKWIRNDRTKELSFWQPSVSEQRKIKNYKTLIKGTLPYPVLLPKQNKSNCVNVIKVSDTTAHFLGTVKLRTWQWAESDMGRL